MGQWVSTPTSTNPAWCRRSTRPVSIKGGNKGTLNLDPINNAQLGGPLAATEAAAAAAPKTQFLIIRSAYGTCAEHCFIQWNAAADVWELSLLLKKLHPFTRGCVKRTIRGMLWFWIYHQCRPVTTLPVKKKGVFVLKMKLACKYDIWRVCYYIFKIKKSWKDKKEKRKKTGDHWASDMARSTCPLIFSQDVENKTHNQLYWSEVPPARVFWSGIMCS